MTAYSIGYEIVCDGPDDDQDCPESAAVRRCFASRTAAEVRADGREQGWTRTRRRRRLADLCPNCQARVDR